jgi:RNA polymerase sigma-70 factor, ECF subfamily
MGSKQFSTAAEDCGHSGLTALSKGCAAPEPPLTPGERAAGERPSRASPTPARLGFDQIYEDHFAFVWRSLRLLGVPPASVEDVTQDTFDVVLQKLSSFEGRSSIQTWLFAIAQRVAANHRRTARRKLQQLRPLSDTVASSEPTPHAHAEARECAEVVQRFIAALDPKLRTVFVLAVLEEVPARDVAQALKIPINTVYTRVHYLREALRCAFERHEEKS